MLTENQEITSPGDWIRRRRWNGILILVPNSRWRARPCYVALDRLRRGNARIHFLNDFADIADWEFTKDVPCGFDGLSYLPLLGRIERGKLNSLTQRRQRMYGRPYILHHQR